MSERNVTCQGWLEATSGKYVAVINEAVRVDTGAVEYRSSVYYAPLYDTQAEAARAAYRILAQSYPDSPTDAAAGKADGLPPGEIRLDLGDDA